MFCLFENSEANQTFPKRIKRSLLTKNHLTMNENQKEDFIKELPLVAEYCR